MTANRALPARTRRLAWTAVIAVVSVGAVVAAPGVAMAATPGGTDWSVPVPLPFGAVSATFEASNVGAGGAPSGDPDVPPRYGSVAWYEFTSLVTGPVSLRATASTGVDHTLEVWDTDTGALVGANDDAHAATDDALVAFTAATGTTYLVGLGSSDTSTGDALLTFDVRSAPSAPTDLVATPGDGTVRLSWSPPTTPHGDLLSYSVGCAPEGFALAECARLDAPGPGLAPASEVLVPGLTNGTAYTFQVSARNSLGWGTASAPVASTPAPPPTIAIHTEPASPRIGQEFRVFFTVTVGGVPVPDTTVAVRFPGGSWVAVPLVDGVYSAGVLVNEPTTYTLTLSHPGGPGIAPATATYSQTFALTAQTITFPQPTSPVSVADGPVTLAATVDTGHAVAYEVVGPCTLSGSSVALDGVGDCVVTATSPASEGFAAAAPVQRTITITGLTQTIGLAAALAGPVTDGVEVDDGALWVPTLTSLGRPVSYLVTGPCGVDSGFLHFTGALGTCHIESSSAGDTTVESVLEAVDVVVRKASQTIELWGPPPTRTGGGGHTVWARSSAGLPVTISVSGPACRYDVNVWFVDVGECVVTASSPGDDLTEPASASLRTVVTAGPQYTELAIKGEVGDRAEGLAVWGWFGALRPGTAVTMTVQSTPVLIGQATADFAGGAPVWGALPALGAGTHHVVLAGTALDGLPVRAELAFGVGADGRITWIGQPAAGARLAATGSEVEATIPLAVLLLVSGVGLVGFRRRLLAPVRA